MYPDLWLDDLREKNTHNRHNGIFEYFCAKIISHRFSDILPFVETNNGSKKKKFSYIKYLVL